MILMLYRAIFVEIHAFFPGILRFEFETLFMRHPYMVIESYGISVTLVVSNGVWQVDVVALSGAQKRGHHPEAPTCRPLLETNLLRNWRQCGLLALVICPVLSPIPNH